MTATATVQPASWVDYWQLTKPRVVLVMQFTAVIGMLLSTPTFPPWLLMVTGFAGIWLCASAAAVCNQFLEVGVDKRMKRTSGRPLARNRLTVRQAQIFALLLAAAGQGILFAFNGWLSAVLTLTATIGYAFYYTLILKPSTSQNIVIGGLAGAAPPLLGWTAITNSADSVAPAAGWLDLCLDPGALWGAGAR